MLFEKNRISDLPNIKMANTSYNNWGNFEFSAATTAIMNKPSSKQDV